MAKELQELIAQIDYHRAARRKAEKEAREHDRAECKLLRKAVKDYGAKLDLDPDAMLASFAPKDD